MSEGRAGANPYVGPRSIRTGERMYGRDRECAQLFNLLLASRIVLLYSPSGAGKSSLLNAGLIPRLREEGFRIRPTMRVGVEPPAGAPAGVNRYVLSALLSLDEDAKDGSFDLTRLAGHTLASYLTDAAGSQQDEAEVLVLDQFEEILTTAPADVPARQEFFAQLGAALRDERRWLVIAMREDFIAGLDPYRGALPTGLRTTFRLDLLGRDAALAAIKGPAADAGVAFLDVAADKLVNDLRQVRMPQADGSVVTQPGPHVEPVQLQVVCRSLWQQLRPEDREIGLDNLSRLGDVDAALANYYDTQVEAVARQCALPERSLRQWIERHLVTANGLRTQVLQTPTSTLGLDNRALAGLVDAHLLRTDTRRGMTWVELAHDRILKPLQESNARWFLAKLSPVQRQAELWNSRGRPEGLLLATAAEAERLLAVPEARPDTEREFLAQSALVRRREHMAARTALWLRLSLVVVAVLVLAWLGIAYVALQDQAEIANARIVQEVGEKAEALKDKAKAELKQKVAETLVTQQLIAEIALHREQQPELAALLGVAAASRLPEPWQRKAALINVGVTAPHLVARVRLQQPGAAEPASGEAPQAWKVAAGGGRLFAIDRAGQVWRVDDQDRSTTPLLPPGLRAVDVAVHPTRPVLALGGYGGTITLWDLEAGAVQATLELSAASDASLWVEGLAFSADGRSLLAVQAADGFIVDLTTRTTRPLGRVAERRKSSDLALSAGGELAVLAPGLPDGTILMLTGGKPKRIVTRAEGCAGPCSFSLARFSPDGSTLLTGGEGVIALWPVKAGMIAGKPAVVPLGAGETVQDAMYMRDGKIAVLTEGRISLWSSDALRPWGTPIQLSSSRVRAISEAGAQGELIAAASATDTPILVLDPRLLAPRGATPRRDPELSFPFFHGPVRAALDPSGATLAITAFSSLVEGGGPTHGQVILHDLAGAAPDRVTTPLVGPQFAAMTFADRGARLVVADSEGKISAWDLSPGAAQAWTRLGSLAERSAIALGVDAQGEIVAASASAGGVKVGHERDGFASTTILGDRKPMSFALAADGRRVALASCVEAALPNLCSRGRIDVHELVAPPGPPLRTLETSFAPELLAFTADGRRLAAGGAQRIRVWDLADGDAVPLTIRPGLGRFTGFDFSSDGAVLVASAVGSNAAVDVVLWRLDTGEELAPPLRVHNPAVGGRDYGQVLLSADGKRVISSGLDGVVVWDIDDEAMQRRACALAGRRLSPGEQARFLGPHHAYPALCPDER